MSLIFRLHARHKFIMPRFLCVLLFCLFGISCKKNNEYSEHGTAYVVAPMTITLPTGLISLTYDDGPGPGTLDLAKYLHSENICATFFVVGDSEAGGGYLHYPILDSLIYYGQRIGSHTFNHKDLKTLSCEDVQYQIKQNQ